MYVEDGVGVTERHLSDVLQQRHLDRAVASVEQNDKVSLDDRQFRRRRLGVCTAIHKSRTL